MKNKLAATQNEYQFPATEALLSATDPGAHITHANLAPMRRHGQRTGSASGSKLDGYQKKHQNSLTKITYKPIDKLLTSHSQLGNTVHGASRGFSISGCDFQSRYRVLARLKRTFPHLWEATTLGFRWSTK